MALGDRIRFKDLRTEQRPSRIVPDTDAEQFRIEGYTVRQGSHIDIRYSHGKMVERPEEPGVFDYEVTGQKQLVIRRWITVGPSQVLNPDWTAIFQQEPNNPTEKLTRQLRRALLKAGRQAGLLPSIADSEDVP